MTKRIYLSGPMTGIPGHNFPAFHEWAARLRAQGHEVVSPAELSEGRTWVECLRVDIRELCGCDAIALMPGWEASKGANLELHVAHRLELEVIPLAAPECTCAVADMPFGRCCKVLEPEPRPMPTAGQALKGMFVGAKYPPTPVPTVPEDDKIRARPRAPSVELARALDKLQARYEARYKEPDQ